LEARAVTNGAESVHALWVLLIGASIVLAAVIRIGAVRLGVPALVGFILIGVGLAWADARLALMTEPVRFAFELFADLGIVALLFRVGLQSHFKALLAKLPSASAVWVGDVVVSGTVGYVAARYLCGLDLLPALVIATALTATSVGVSTSVWLDAGALQSPTGRLLVDVAELDDVSAVVLMALLFAVVPTLRGGEATEWLTVVAAGGVLLLKLGAFVAVCSGFSTWVEPRITRLARAASDPPQWMLIVAGVGFIIAAAADGLGFSLAIGALFAGLVFSRDPAAVRTEARFENIYALFVPFFFLRIGLHIDVDTLGQAVGLGLVLAAAAALGKLLGAGLPARVVQGPSAGMSIGLSMVPRAEIAMVVVDAGRRLGADVMPEAAYGAMVVVVLTTCLVTPWLLARRLPSGRGTGAASH
jgi:Kef-type K+ transport system membrane component KefB